MEQVAREHSARRASGFELRHPVVDCVLVERRQRPAATSTASTANATAVAEQRGDSSSNRANHASKGRSPRCFARASRSSFRRAARQKTQQMTRTTITGPTAEARTTASDRRIGEERHDSMVEPRYSGRPTTVIVSSRCSRVVVDLQRRVLDLEPAREQLLELAPDRVAVVARMHEHVRRQRRESPSRSPRRGGRGRSRRAGGRRARCRSPRRSSRRARPRAARVPESRSRPEAARSMIAAIARAAIPSASPEAGREDHGAGDGGQDERGEVGEEVLERALDVHARPVRLRDLPGREQVDDDPDERDDEHRQPAGPRRRDDPLDRRRRRSARRGRAA